MIDEHSSSFAVTRLIYPSTYAFDFSGLDTVSVSRDIDRETMCVWMEMRNHERWKQKTFSEIDTNFTKLGQMTGIAI